MTFRTLNILRAAAAATGLLFAAGFSQAQYTNMEDMQRRLSELEQQVNDLQRPQSRYTAIAYDADGNTVPEADTTAGSCNTCNNGTSCDSCGDGCSVANCQPRAWVGRDFLNSCRTCGVIAGAELLFLKPVATNGQVPGQTFSVSVPSVLPTAVTVNSSSPWNFETSPRFWLGAMNANGLGFRVQYWEFDHGVGQNQLLQNGPGLLQTSGSMRFRTFDWEGIQQVNFNRWKMLFFGGFRYAEISQSETITLMAFNNPSSTANSFHGIGLTGGANMYYSLFGSQNFGWFTNFRGSLVYGDRTYNCNVNALNINDLVSGNSKLSGDSIGILELATGPQIQRQIRSGGYVFLRGGFETQLWVNSGTIYSMPQSGTIGNVGLGGFSIATGIVR